MGRAELIGTEEVAESRVVRVPESPMTFDAFVGLPDDSDLELVNGVLVKRMAAQLDHERLFAWLFTILNLYVSERDLGLVLGSRTAVEISPFGGRLPDVVFVRRERLDIVRQRGIYGAPDLVVEIVSPNDRPSEVIALESEYRGLGVTEIWIVDRRRERVRALHLRDGEYTEEDISEGDLMSSAVHGFRLRAEWLLREPRPKEHEILKMLQGD